jgi:hypothetical protein
MTLRRRFTRTAIAIRTATSREIGTHEQRRSGRASAGQKRPLSSAPATALQAPARTQL